MRALIEHDIPLAPLTTLELGGAARYFVTAIDDETVEEALRWAEEQSVEVRILGGGSNLVVPDEGVGGLVIHLAQRGVTFEGDGDEALVTARAGEPWDAFVAETVSRGLAGLECLSGIPGLVGATPIQNVGAYGQDVAETIRSVRVLDRDSRLVREIAPEACEFAYRDSAFKRNPNRHVVLAVTFALKPGGAPAVRYAELERAVSALGETADLSSVRRLVLELRRRKSMVIDPTDDNRRSAGSFFTNPIVDDGQAKRLVAFCVAEGIVDDGANVPCWPAGEGKSKLAAGWLIERAGIRKGFRRGAVGVSTQHALALVHHGGGTTAELLALAGHIRDVVHGRFGIELVPEPVRW